MDYLRLEGLSALVQELARQSEIAKVLSSVVDAVVDANGRALVDEMRVELEHALSEVREAEAEAGRLRDDRATFVAEASRLRAQLVNDYRQILQQLNERDELRSQLSFLQQRMLQLNGRQYNVQKQHAPPDDQQQHQRQRQQQHQHQKAPPAYLSIPGDADVSSTLPPPPRYTHNRVL